MTIHQLKKKLSSIADISVLKEGYVFTLLMTGDGLSKWNNVSEIERAVLAYTNKKFDVVEVIKNTESYFLMVLKPSLP